jgi:hypothetical protein
MSHRRYALVGRGGCCTQTLAPFASFSVRIVPAVACEVAVKWVRRYGAWVKSPTGETAVCRGVGLCDTTTGLCLCKDGFQGNSCSRGTQCLEAALELPPPHAYNLPFASTNALVQASVYGPHSGCSLTPLPSPPLPPTFFLRQLHAPLTATGEEYASHLFSQRLALGLSTPWWQTTLRRTLHSMKVLRTDAVVTLAGTVLRAINVSDVTTPADCIGSTNRTCEDMHVSARSGLRARNCTQKKNDGCGAAFMHVRDPRSMLLRRQRVYDQPTNVCPPHLHDLQHTLHWYNVRWFAADIQRSHLRCHVRCNCNGKFTFDPPTSEGA